MKKNNQNYKKKNSGSSSLTFSILIGIVSGVSSTLLLSVVLSALSLKFRNPINFGSVLSIISVAFGSTLCGIASSSTYKNNSILSSQISILILSVISVLTVLNTNNNSIINILFFPLMIYIFGTVASLITSGSFKRKKVKKYFR